jgi:O-antigen/teichoic acid export membrane protein
LLGLATALVAAAAAPVLEGFLHLDGVGVALWMAASIAPVPAMFTTVGMLQGEERFVGMSVVLLVLPTVKVVLGVLFVDSGFGVSGALAAATLGGLAGSVAGLVAARPGITGRFDTALRRDLLRVLAAGLALFFLTNIDLLLARHYLGRHASGLYAAGALVAKIAFFGPQFVTAVVFPRLTSPAERQRLLGGTLAAVAGCCVVGVAVLSLIARPFLGGVFGSEYEGLGHVLWLFGALGTALALLQVVMYSALAAGDSRLVGAMWMTAGIEVALLGLFHRSIAQMVGLALVPIVVVLLLGLAIERSRDGSASGADPTPVLG